MKAGGGGEEETTLGAGRGGLTGLLGACGAGEGARGEGEGTLGEGSFGALVGKASAASSASSTAGGGAGSGSGSETAAVTTVVTTTAGEASDVRWLEGTLYCSVTGPSMDVTTMVVGTGSVSSAEGGWGTE